MAVNSLVCNGCHIELDGHFQFPRIARLSADHLKLAEAFLLSAGNLKELAATLDISYPTLRKRIDEMVAALTRLRTEDETGIKRILMQIEKGEISAELGTRLIKEMSGEL